MPISAENKKRYPPDWKAISRRIRFDRAKGRCECRGECGTAHRSPHYLGNVVVVVDRCGARNREPHPVTGSRVVLTVAHLDHTPENCDEGNLKAMCQRCHLSYDKDEHARTRAANNA